MEWFASRTSIRCSRSGLIFAMVHLSMAVVTGNKGSNKKQKKAHGAYKYTCFFGQLPYDTTKEELEAELKRAGVEKAMVRLLTDKVTKKFRGAQRLLLIGRGVRSTRAQKRRAPTDFDTGLRGAGRSSLNVFVPCTWAGRNRADARALRADFVFGEL